MTERVNPWAEIVGPCYTAAAIPRLLGMTLDEVDEARRDVRLLALETDGGVTLYPAWQIHDGRAVDGLREVLTILRTGVDDPWTWAQWLVAAPVSAGEGRRHIDELRDGLVAEVVRVARHDAAAWAQ